LAIRHLLEFRHFFWMLYALAAAAVLLAQRGEGQRAAAMYTLLLRYEFVANSKWFQAVYGRPIKNLIAKDILAVDDSGEAAFTAQDVWQTARTLLNGNTA
jgi:hypothetical protein